MLPHCKRDKPSPLFVCMIPQHIDISGMLSIRRTSPGCQSSLSPRRSAQSTRRTQRKLYFIAPILFKIIYIYNFTPRCATSKTWFITIDLARFCHRYANLVVIDSVPLYTSYFSLHRARAMSRTAAMLSTVRRCSGRRIWVYGW